MNINECAVNLLSYFSPEERSIPDSDDYPGRNAAVRKALNHALQELYGKGKPWVKRDERGAVVNAPTTVTIAVQAGSKSATITGWQDWMAGCSIVIDGAAVDNQIRNASSPVVLKFPYSGTTGSKSATVYHNSVEVDADVLEVLEPVKLDGRKINPIPAPLNDASRREFDFEFVDPPVVNSSVSVTASTPVAFSVDTWSPDDVTPARLRVRLSPAPAAAHFLEFPVLLRPPRITDLSSTNSLPVPFDYIESVFLPIALQKLRECPFWRGIVGEDSVATGYSDATDTLKAVDPRPAGGIRFTSRF